MAFRKFIMPVLLASASCSVVAGAAQAQAPAGQAQNAVFSIPAGDLAPALQLFARQAGVEVIFSAAELQGLRTAGVSGRLSPREALARLLQGTGLSTIQDSSGAYLVRPAQRAEADPVLAVPEPAAEEPAIVVTGSRIPGVDVPAPTLILRRDDFAQGGFTSIEEVFESLPQNFDEVTPEGRFANEGGSLLRGLNNERATAIDLRGLGAQSTLTLLNGTRRAGSVDGRVVDISVIPLSIIDRVEVVTGGRSAIYGADAVAGVVNLVTRRTFKGAETHASFGFAEDGGGEQLQLGQIVGVENDRGGFVAAYDFSREWPLDLADVGLLSLEPNPEIGLTQLSLNAQVDSRRHSGFLSGRYDVSDTVEVYADTLYSRKKFADFSERFFEGANENSFTDTHNKAEHFSVSGGTRAKLGSDWSLNVSGGWSSARNRQDSLAFIDLGFISLDFDSTSRSKATVAIGSAVAEGPLFSIGGMTPRLAIGAEWRREGLETSFNGIEENDDSRTVRSLFGELLLPVARDGGPGLNNLEITLAGRYDDYSDFGGTFNPQAGVSWEPFRGLTFRGAYSRAFRAPALVELDSAADAFIEFASDPAQGGVLVPVLFLQGGSEDLGPEKAKSWTIGVDYVPDFAPWLKTSLSYFDIKYDGRIEQPSINADRELVLERAGRFPGLITLMPTAAQAQAFVDLDADAFIDNDTGVPFDPATDNILDVFPDLVLFDNRITNIAVEQVRGLDFSVDAAFDTGAGRFDLGLNFTHTVDHERNVTPASPAFSLLNEVGKPVDTRARAKVGWSKGAFSAFGFVNYVDDYKNPFSSPPSRMDSWTTVDLTLRFQGANLAAAGVLKDVDAALSVKNLFDNGPPVFRGSLLGVLYDSTNANPVGRNYTLRLTKRW